MIDARVLSDALSELGRFSAEGPGVTRFAYDGHWCEAHRWLGERARTLGLAATSDAAGNLFLHPPDVTPGTPAVLVGSHLDTVRQGGLYDGAYGALCGLFVAAEMRERNELPVVGLVTAEEEGSRYSGDMLGTRALLGRAGAEELDTALDGAGISWRAALRYARERGCAAPLGDDARPCPVVFPPAAMIEIHIEQGPVLETERLALGIVEHIVGYRRLRVRLRGEARHAGTTPMRLRRDALAAAAEMILAVEHEAREMGEPAVATSGYVNAEPGLYNVVPGAAELWIEVRHMEPARISALEEGVRARCRSIAARREIEMELEQVAGLDPAAMSPALVRDAVALAGELNMPHRRMASGAGHDAMVFAAAGIPTLMLFVPSRGGISHAPEEHTEPADLWAGYEFLRTFVRRLTRVPEAV